MTTVTVGAHGGRSHTRRCGWLALIVAGATAVAAQRAAAQTDYYNTSAGRPLRVEDAMPLEYRALEFDVAPLRLERGRGGTYRWSLAPGVAAGILPRTQVHLGIPVTYADVRDAGGGGGLAGIELAALYSLNAETAIPALAVAADVHLPVGRFAGDDGYATFRGIVTRTFPWARVHANAEITAGPSRVPGDENTTASWAEADRSRWLAGLAIDRAFPLRALLISAETYLEQPIRAADDARWTAATGLRYQLAPRWALDAGVGRRLTGEDPAWFVTVGWAVAMGLP